MNKCIISMKYAGLILFTFCVNALFSQAPRFVVNPNPVSVSFSADFGYHKARGSLKNNMDSSIYILWTREILELPQGWGTYVADSNIEYAEFIDKCPEKYSNKVKAFDSISLEVNVSDNGINGQAHVVLWVFEKEDTTKKIKVDYLFNKVVSNGEVRNIEIKMYPNPAYNSFTVDYNQGLNKIELYSLLGLKVISYTAFPNHSYDISQLADGIYFVKLIGSNNQLIKTIRLLKRSYKP